MSNKAVPWVRDGKHLHWHLRSPGPAPTLVPSLPRTSSSRSHLLWSQAFRPSTALHVMRLYQVPRDTSCDLPASWIICDPPHCWHDVWCLLRFARWTPLLHHCPHRILLWPQDPISLPGGDFTLALVTPSCELTSCLPLLAPGSYSTCFAMASLFSWQPLARWTSYCAPQW